MPTRDSITKTARITREDWETIERSGKTFSGWVHEKAGKNDEWSAQKGTPQKDKGNTPKGTPLSESVEDLEKMLKLLGSTLDEGIEAFRNGLEDGTLTYENGEVLVNVPQYDLSGFLRACEEKKVDPQKMIEKMTQNVYRS